MLLGFGFGFVSVFWNAFWTLFRGFVAGLLFCNAMAVLNEHRFLGRMGLTLKDDEAGDERKKLITFKYWVTRILQAARWSRQILILVNGIIICILLLLGYWL